MTRYPRHHLLRSLARFGLSLVLLCAFLLFSALPAQPNYGLTAQQSPESGSSRRVLLISEAREESSQFEAGASDLATLSHVAVGVVATCPLSLDPGAGVGITQEISDLLPTLLRRRVLTLITSRGPPTAQA